MPDKDHIYTMTFIRKSDGYKHAAANNCGILSYVETAIGLWKFTFSEE